LLFKCVARKTSRNDCTARRGHHLRRAERVPFSVTDAVIARRAGAASFPILGAITFCHVLNDLSTSLLLAIYPLLKSGFDLSFGQIGLLTLVFQGTASLLQPAVGHFTDRRPQPYALPFGMAAVALGLAVVAFAPNYGALLAGCAFLGIGSSIFHPESSRIARLASGGAHGFAQSLFQVGGNFGNSLAPLAAAVLVLPYGQRSIAWFAVLAVAGIAILARLGHTFGRSALARPRARASAVAHPAALSPAAVRRAITVLIALIFSKYFYLASITSYYIFYLIHHFGLSVEHAQLCLFAFLVSAAAGTFIGGPIGDRVGRKRVIWCSILGVVPFTLALPYVGLAATVALSIVIGLIISSAFSAIVVYAQELIPGRVGMVSGLFFGVAFGMAGLGAAALGELIDLTSIDFVYRICSFLPLIGVLTAFLPDVERVALRGLQK
jgi:MFS transporter, FSR family, fosmidomycin resistance protein